MEPEIGIAKEHRQKLAEGLARVLADTYLLYHKTHGYHWNVTGPDFRSLHLMFMEQYTELFAAIDEIAERIRALGHFAPASYGAYAQLSRIKDDTGVPEAGRMVANLVRDHEQVIATLREVIPLAEAANDQGTLDLLTQRLRAGEKTAWMLRSLVR